MSAHLTLSLWHNLRDSPPQYRVRIDAGDPLKAEASSRVAICALSPIFSIGDSPFIPSNGHTYRIVFLAHHHPFVEIEALSAEAKQFLWISLGITSIIAILPLENSNTEIDSFLAMRTISCRETWIIENYVLTNEGGQVYFDAREIPEIIYDLPSKLPSNPELYKVIRELHLNFDALLKRASVLMPSLLPIAQKMVQSINDGINTITTGEEAILQINLGGVPSAKDTEKSLEIHKRINLSVDELVQLNSALAYILSQSFYGGPPLKQNLSLISCHSLLGIGTAIKAIQRLTDFVIHGFAKHPVSLAIKEDYPTTTVETYLHGNPPPHALTPDYFLKKHSIAPQAPKLAYFSSRNGFSEQGYCVTAAIQCLSSADEAKRSLLTLTHELLHSHVKGLIATIFNRVSNPAANDASTLLEYVREYKGLCADLNQDSTCQSSWNIPLFIRFRLFAFSDGIFKVLSDYPDHRADKPSGINVAPGPDPDVYGELARYNNAYWFINELIVHILDFHYFYDASPRLYLSTLWKSWSNIPGVANKIEWYILRCLVAISVANVTGLCKKDFPLMKCVTYQDSESLDNRFDSAARSLQDVLEELSKASESGPMLAIVLDKLKTPAIRTWLRMAFFPSHLMAQVVKQFLYSPQLRKYFDTFEDPLADRDAGGEPTYHLDAFEFTTTPIKNPIALLRDRLAREMSATKPLGEDARSAWLFLALASLEATS